MPRVLVTGAGGFTGRHLAAELAAGGYECVGLTARPGEMLPPPYAQAFGADLLEADRLLQAVRQARPDYVVHLAAVAFVGHGNAAQFYATNVVGTRNLLEAVAQLPAPPAMTLLASSANVYGNGLGLAEGTVFTEDCAPAPANDYAVSKLAMEYVARLYMERLPIVVTRPFNYTGPGQAEHFLVPKIVANARRRAPVLELGNLDVARDFSDVRTVAGCYRRLLACPQAASTILNVCSGRVVTLRAILELVRHLSGHAPAVEVNPAFVRPNEVKVLRGSRARLEALIGAVPEIPFEDTLRWMLQAPGETAAAA